MVLLTTVLDKPSGCQWCYPNPAGIERTGRSANADPNEARSGGFPPWLVVWLKSRDSFWMLRS